MTLLAGFIGSLICAGFAAAHYSSYMADAAQYIPASQLPANGDERVSRSFDLVTRYPKDPRAHLFHAIFLMGQKSFGAAEGKCEPPCRSPHQMWPASRCALGRRP